MNQKRLIRLLRQALQFSAAAPVVLAPAACGGRVDTPAPVAMNPPVPLPNGHPDAGPSVDAAASPCSGQACSVKCDTGYEPAPPVCVYGTLQCTCVPVDAGSSDATIVDAIVPPDVVQPPDAFYEPDVGPPVDAGPPDSGDPCMPNTNECGYPVPLSCFDTLIAADAGYLDPSQCATYCGPQSVGGCYVGTEPNQASAVYCNLCHTGRRPPQWSRPARPRRRPRERAAAAYLAEAAELEAWSVDAFVVLHDELSAHGAPSELLARAKRAARDEVRHARVTHALARRYGSRLAAPATRRRASGVGARPFVAVAIDNVIEGCVRETFGALVALAQAHTAADPEVRAAMKRIALDEARHAALGWAVAEWARGRLSPDEQERVRGAGLAAVEQLATDAAREPASALRDLGVPSAQAARRMVSELRRTLWDPLVSGRVEDHGRSGERVRDGHLR